MQFHNHLVILLHFELFCVKIIFFITDKTFFMTDAQFNTSERVNPKYVAIKG